MFHFFQRFWPSFLLLCTLNQAYADGLISSVTGISLHNNEKIRNLGLELGGWVSSGISYAANNPDDHNNFPLTFNDRSSEFQLNQLNLFLERAVNKESEDWDFGGRFDFMFGTDSRFTQSAGLDDKFIDSSDLRFYDFALPQAYVEMYAPYGNGITIKLGHFYTIIGYEVVTAPDNFFYSHAYTMQYAEPFTHTGVLMEYPLSSNFSLSLGSVMGWDNSDQNPGSWSFLGGISWLNDEATTSAALSLVTGDVDESLEDNRTMYSLVLTHSLTDQLNYVFQHDFGFHEQAAANGSDAYWFGINQYLFYDFNDQFSFGLRGEWFRDADDSRLNVGAPASYYAISGGINWSPVDWATFRPEIRYDWADSRVNVYDNQTEDDHLTFSIDLVITL